MEDIKAVTNVGMINKLDDMNMLTSVKETQSLHADGNCGYLWRNSHGIDGVEERGSMRSKTLERNLYSVESV
ncbi:uncharacterized protein N7487_007999 [Penicillium crustosum]|uniref:uncharacterized protein n=1 Tax=Penicillium crustosum TaxID=36656 RepID=UPI002395C9C4|nr:uncharacterized protein N7487_007999 [Penicillium crustosum]KAJ5402103.1 hypothetical protein N7487_007999 [Penicillium crustosum]